ncbi:MAG TPA: hypothetical protein VFB72_14930 [Verrucomicrobiae bacterium]|nr:hypothetical protein [Verrucomicrobiae bacterium]
MNRKLQGIFAPACVDNLTFGRVKFKRETIFIFFQFCTVNFRSDSETHPTHEINVPKVGVLVSFASAAGNSVKY